MVEHLRPLLDNPRDMHNVLPDGEQLAQVGGRSCSASPILLRRLTALRKPGGGVKSIVAGDVFRRSTSKTMAQQLVEAVKRATSPFQYAAGCECIAHALQALTEVNLDATILLVDGIGVFDLVSRGAMLQGLCDVSPSAVPFVRQFHGSPSHYLWENDIGEVFEIDQSLGLHNA